MVYCNVTIFFNKLTCEQFVVLIVDANSDNISSVIRALYDSDRTELKCQRRRPVLMIKA